MNKSNITIWSYWEDSCALLLFVLLLFMQCAHAQTAPTAPTIGPAWSTRGGATVSFNAPTSTGGSSITGYTVTSNPGNLTATGTASPITITGLTSSSSYTFSVAANNSVGTGTQSASSNPVTAQPFAPTTGTINNIVVFVRFSDQPEFTQTLSYYDGLFNSASNSVKNFYLQNSYNALTVSSTFYPSQSGNAIVSYQDTNPTSYYQPYNATSNPNGYPVGQGSARETALVINILNAISSQIPSGLTLDGNGDGYVDHITFEVYSSTSYPNPSMFNSRATFDISGGVTLNGLKLGNYTWISGSEGGATATNQFGGTEIHEMGHSLGYPDLRNNGQFYPVGNYDVMSLGTAVHSGAYEKYKFTNWIPTIPTISTYGTYTLNDITQSSSNSYKIAIPNSNEYLVLEYRKIAGQFESNLPGSGLCITRVNESAGKWGNLGGPPFMLYYFRANGTFSQDSSAGNLFTCLDANAGQTQFNDYSNPACFLSNGTPCGISITNIGAATGTSISFSLSDPATTVVTHSIKGNVTYSNGSRVVGATVSLSGDATGTISTPSTGGLIAYLFTVNAGGNYTIVPFMANVTFSPPSVTLNNLTSDTVQNFVATKVTNTISGQVASSGSALVGVPVIINCPGGGNYVGSTTTDSSGNYSFTVDSGSTCSIWPSIINYFFSPSSPTFTNITTNQVQNFNTYTANVILSGVISSNGTNLSGVSVSCPGANTSTPIITNASGAYSFTVTIGNGSGYTVTPSSSLYTFSPANKTYNGIVSSQTQNFTGTPLPTYTVTYSGNGNTGGAVPTDAGTYVQGATVTVLGNTGTLVKTGYTFSGWNMSTNGSGTAQAAGSSFLMGSANVTLYAQWTPITTTTTAPTTTTTSPTTTTTIASTTTTTQIPTTTTTTTTTTTPTTTTTTVPTNTTATTAPSTTTTVPTTTSTTTPTTTTTNASTTTTTQIPTTTTTTTPTTTTTTVPMTTTSTTTPTTTTTIASTTTTTQIPTTTTTTPTTTTTTVPTTTTSTTTPTTTTTIANTTTTTQIPTTTTTTTTPTTTTTTVPTTTTSTTTPTTTTTIANTTTTTQIPTTTTTTTTTTTVTSTTTTTLVSPVSSINFVSGWNLAGNSINAPLQVSPAFSNSTNVSTVWKWETSGTTPGITYPAWAFYTPLQADGGLAYATSKGYDFLTVINGGEGFWVNAKSVFALQLPSGTPIASSDFADQSTPPNKLPSGWSLIATGDDPTPRNFANTVSLTPPTAPNAVATSLTTLWAWDSVNTIWYFYAPSLDISGGLTTYITSKNYEDFTAKGKTLDSTTGFWVNHP